MDNSEVKEFFRVHWEKLKRIRKDNPDIPFEMAVDLVFQDWRDISDVTNFKPDDDAA